jgi:hypothetical protein
MATSNPANRRPRCCCRGSRSTWRRASQRERGKRDHQRSLLSTAGVTCQRSRFLRSTHSYMDEHSRVRRAATRRGCKTALPAAEATGVSHSLGWRFDVARTWAAGHESGRGTSIHRQSVHKIGHYANSMWGWGRHLRCLCGFEPRTAKRCISTRLGLHSTIDSAVTRASIPGRRAGCGSKPHLSTANGFLCRRLGVEEAVTGNRILHTLTTH